MRNKGTWKTPLEIEYCLVCGKPFMRYRNFTKSSRNRQNIKMAKVRPFSSVNCSKKCSREYIRKPFIKRKEQKIKGDKE
jgi:hypothetical protein